ncbi:WG repeat-containing protein [Actinoplanes sp. CA-051413]|uniref:WG repeat-containing protein n=1 Tax=Actinoplanes sp. CA-051413 TaxID=3239899 RepID=UPI003D9703FF
MSAEPSPVAEAEAGAEEPHGLGWLLSMSGLGAVTPEPEPAAPDPTDLIIETPDIADDETSGATIDDSPADAALATTAPISGGPVSGAPVSSLPTSGAAVKQDWFSPTTETRMVRPKSAEVAPEDEAPAEKQPSADTAATDVATPVTAAPDTADADVTDLESTGPDLSEAAEVEVDDPQPEQEHLTEDPAFASDEPNAAVPAAAEPEPAAAEPVDAEPTIVEPADAEPVAVEPVAVEPADAEPVVVQPGVSEPVDVEWTDIEPADPQPEAAEQADSQPADPELANPEPVDPEPVDAELVDEEPTSPEIVDAELADPELIDTDIVDAELVDAEVVEAELVDAQPIDAEPADAQPVQNEPIDAELIDTELVDAEVVDAELVETAPSDADPIQTDQADTPPVEGEADQAEQVAAGPPDAETVDAELVEPEPAKTDPVNATSAENAEPQPAEPQPAEPEHAQAEPLRRQPAPPRTGMPSAPPDPEPERRRADPEQILAAYPWKVDPVTLRETVDDPEPLLAVRDRLTDRLEYAERDIVRAGLLGLRAVTSRVLGDLGWALADAREALRHAEATGELRLIALAQARLAQVQQWQGDFAEADRLFEEASSVELPDRLRAELHVQAGKSGYEQGRFLEACNHFEAALELRRVEDPELVARTEAALDAVMDRVREAGWGPYPRSREEILQRSEPPHPALDYDSGWQGYADSNGEVVIPERYAEAQPFHEGVAWVRRPGTAAWELIDETGALVIDPSSGYVQVSRFADGLAWVSRDPAGGWFAVDWHNRVIVPGGFEDVRPFRHGLAVVRRGGWGAVDQHGRIVVQLKYQRFATELTAGGPVEGFTGDGLAVIDAGDRLGVVDRTGQLRVAPVHARLLIHPMAFIVGDRDGRWGALDRDGDPVLEVTRDRPADVVDEIERLLSGTRPVL